MPSNRALNLMATFNGANQVVANVTRIAVWKEALGDGTLPGSTPYKEYVGPAEIVNADPWKLGSDAT